MNCQSRLSVAPMSAERHPLRRRLASQSKAGVACHSRAGRALTELALIAVVPCFSLLILTLMDGDLRQGLLARPNADYRPYNVVYGLIPTDEGTVASLHSQGQVRFWNLATSAVLGEIQSDLSELRFGAYSRKQRLLALGSAMGGLEIWDVTRPHRPIASSVDPSQVVTCCQFTPDGSLLVCADELGSLSLWEPLSLRRLQVVQSSTPSETVRSLAISEDGTQALTGLRNGCVQLWDLQQRAPGPAFQIARAAILPDSSIESVAFLPGGTEFIAAVRAEGAIVCQVKTGAWVRRCAEPLDNIRSAALSADSSRFVVGSDLGRLSVWEVSTGRQVKELEQQSAIIRALACDERANRIVSGDWSGSVHIHQQ